MEFSFGKSFRAGRSIFLVCASLVLSTATAVAQTSRVVLPDQTVTLFRLFDEIKRQANYTVVLDAGNATTEQRVTFAERSGSVDYLLDRALPRTRYARMTINNFIVVRTLPARRSATATPPPQPTREEFESDVAEYTRRYIPQAEMPAEVRYDTIRTVTPYSGIFGYPGREFTPALTLRPVSSPFARNTPPLLAVKTNLVWWAARGTLNIGGEVGLGQRTSLELSGGINRWNLEGSAENNRKLAHWVVKPEFRYWLCERFYGHFFGVHALYGQYNVGGYNVPLLFRKEYRYEGSAWGAGVNYGYHLPLSRRWGAEFTAGVGVLMLDHVKKDCEKCGSTVAEEKKTYFGPTELGVKLVFMIK